MNGEKYQQSRKRTVSKRYKTRAPVFDAKAVTTLCSQTCNTTGAATLINGIVPGYAVDQRLGRVVTIDRIDGIIEVGVTATTGIDQYQRWMLVLDRQPNGAALAVTDVLDSTAINSHLNLANRSRFKVLADHVLALNASGEPGSRRTYVARIPMNDRVVFNSGTAGTIADIVTTSIYFLTVGGEAAGVTAGSASGDFRVWFHNSV
jgi:hypothetical protein